MFNRVYLTYPATRNVRKRKRHKATEEKEPWPHAESAFLQLGSGCDSHLSSPCVRDLLRLFWMSWLFTTCISITIKIRSNREHGQVGEGYWRQNRPFCSDLLSVSLKARLLAFSPSIFYASSLFFFYLFIFPNTTFSYIKTKSHRLLNTPKCASLYVL